jgi:hypothetical protein
MGLKRLLSRLLSSRMVELCCEYSPRTLKVPANIPKIKWNGADSKTPSIEQTLKMTQKCIYIATV